MKEKRVFIIIMKRIEEGPILIHIAISYVQNKNAMD
jgi:hypothetical protein